MKAHLFIYAHSSHSLVWSIGITDTLIFSEYARVHIIIIINESAPLHLRAFFALAGLEHWHHRHFDFLRICSRSEVSFRKSLKNNFVILLEY